MSEDSHPSVSGPIPAGWYPDPAGGEGKRWWDGRTWTANVQEPEATPPPPSFGNYVPVELRAGRPIAIAEAGIAYTRASWWIAGSPLWLVVPQAALVELVNALAPQAQGSLVLGGVLYSVLVWVALIGLAFADRDALRRGGNATAASPWWMLLSPLVYLILRAGQVNRYATGGWASVIWWCIAALLSPGVAVLAIFAVAGIVVT